MMAGLDSADGIPEKKEVREQEARGGITVGDGPAGLLARLRLGRLDRFGQHVQNAGVDDRLSGCRGAGKDVAQGSWGT